MGQETFPLPMRGALQKTIEKHWHSKRLPVVQTGVAQGIFRRGELTLPTRRLKYGFEGTINAKNLRKNHFSPSDGWLACSDAGAIAL